jgi:hypothetical protein
MMHGGATREPRAQCRTPGRCANQRVLQRARQSRDTARSSAGTRVRAGSRRLHHHPDQRPPRASAPHGAHNARRVPRAAAGCRCAHDCIAWRGNKGVSAARRRQTARHRLKHAPTPKACPHCHASAASSKPTASSPCACKREGAVEGDIRHACAPCTPPRAAPPCGGGCPCTAACAHAARARLARRRVGVAQSGHDLLPVQQINRKGWGWLGGCDNAAGSRCIHQSGRFAAARAGARRVEAAASSGVVGNSLLALAFGEGRAGHGNCSSAGSTRPRQRARCNAQSQRRAAAHPLPRAWRAPLPARRPRAAARVRRRCRCRCPGAGTTARAQHRRRPPARAPHPRPWAAGCGRTAAPPLAQSHGPRAP